MIGSLFLNKTYSRNELKGLLQSILFVNGKSLSMEELKKIFEMGQKEILGLIEETNDDFKKSFQGLTIIPVAGGYQMVTNPHYKEELTEIFGKRNESKIPKSSLETLAVIAYKQPVSKEDIDKIRGVSSTRSINTLLALKLVTISGSADDIVKSPIYSTTDRFLELFRIKSLDDLPSLNTIDFDDFLGDEAFGDEESEDEADLDAGPGPGGGASMFEKNP